MTKRRIVLLGSSGLLGSELARIGWPEGVDLLTPRRNSVDLTDGDCLNAYIHEARPEAIINCAAYTAVDQAEMDPSGAYALNAEAPHRLALLALQLDLPLIHISTDYVFDGSSGPYSEFDPCAPLNVYGASKFAGEEAILQTQARAAIVRTAWLQGASAPCFVSKILDRARTQPSLEVVGDQRGNPTSANDLAQAVLKVALRMSADRDAPVGVFHAVNSGEATWAELASYAVAESVRLGGPATSIIPTSSAKRGTGVRRPPDSRLTTNRILRAYDVRLRPWRDGVSEIVAALNLRSVAA